MWKTQILGHYSTRESALQNYETHFDWTDSYTTGCHENEIYLVEFLWINDSTKVSNKMEIHSTMETRGIFMCPGQCIFQSARCFFAITEKKIVSEFVIRVKMYSCIVCSVIQAKTILESDPKLDFDLLSSILRGHFAIFLTQVILQDPWTRLRDFTELSGVLVVGCPDSRDLVVTVVVTPCLVRFSNLSGVWTANNNQELFCFTWTTLKFYLRRVNVVFFLHFFPQFIVRIIFNISLFGNPSEPSS